MKNLGKEKEEFSMFSFIKPQNPVLRKSSHLIPNNQIYSDQIRIIIKSMLNIANSEQKHKNKPIMVGLAAVQIGILKRIILVDTAADGKGRVGKMKVFINPKIIWQSKQKLEWYEGCYSIPNVCGIVSRSKSIKVSSTVIYKNLSQAKQFKQKYSGYVARIFQHEIDHLNGKFFADLIVNQDNLHWVKKSEFSNYRNKLAWKKWRKKCTFAKLQKIQGL